MMSGMCEAASEGVSELKERKKEIERQRESAKLQRGYIFFFMHAEKNRICFYGRKWTEIKCQRQGGKTTKAGLLSLYPQPPTPRLSLCLIERKGGPLAVSDYSCEVN